MFLFFRPNQSPLTLSASSLLTLGIAHASMALLSLTRSLDLRSSLLTLGIAHASMALLSLTRSLQRTAFAYTLGLISPQQANFSKPPRV